MARAGRIGWLAAALLGVTLLLAAPANAQVFMGQYCWTVTITHEDGYTVPPPQPQALVRFGVTNTGPSYYLLQGFVDLGPDGYPLLMGSGIAVGPSIFFTFALTHDAGFWKSKSQLQAVLDGSLNGSMWEIGQEYDSGSPTPYYNYYTQMALTYNPSCTPPPPPGP